ncbi:MAG: hypothetical protein MUF42_01480 [Cytophagaceae bacterium]|jgi:YbbR domain-containing protein|nr:hypothetical protein [Cytophagaceae bacterium]
MKKVVRLLGIKRSDWLPIASCLLAAVTFWFFVSMNDDYSIEVSHPLEVKYDPDLYVPISAPPKEVRFSTTASGWDLLQKTSFINSSPIEISLDEFKKRRYLSSSRLKPIVERQMRGIKINYIQEDTIWVNFEKKRNQKIKVRLQVSNYLAEGVELDGPVIINPSEVDIIGPGSLIRKAPLLLDLSLPHRNISGTYQEDIELHSEMEGLSFKPEEVHVSFKTILLESQSDQFQITKVNFPKRKNIKLSESQVTLTLYYREGDKEKAKAFKPQVMADFNQLNEQKKTIKLQLKNTPDWLRSAKIEPSYVQIRYGE